MAPLVGRSFLEDLALVLCVAAVATVLFQLLRQPLVVGYLVAGMAVGPHVPLPIYVPHDRIEQIADLGVILLIFSIGLEFKLRRLLSLAPTAGLVTLIQVAVMLGLGYGAGRLLGWTPMESVFTGAILSISSTTIVAKAFEEQEIDARVRGLCFGILLAEDLVAIVLLALLTAAAAGEALSLRSFSITGGRLLLFLTALIVIGLCTVPYAIRAVARLGRPETLLITSVGLCFAFAMAAEHARYSVALGAFLAGSLVAESGQGTVVEHLVEPIRDIFGAVFFVSVGMMINPALLVQYWMAVLVLSGLVVVGKIAAVTGASLLIGEPGAIAIMTGFALAQIGEFSFIIADVGRSGGATRPFVYSIAVAVSTITAFLTPFLIGASAPAAVWLRHHLPRPVTSMLAHYEGWVTGLRRQPQPQIEEE